MNDWAQKVSDASDKRQRKAIRIIHLKNIDDILKQMIRKLEIKKNPKQLMGDEQIINHFENTLRITVIENKDNIEVYDKKDYF